MSQKRHSWALGTCTGGLWRGFVPSSIKTMGLCRGCAQAMCRMRRRTDCDGLWPTRFEPGQLVEGGSASCGFRMTVRSRLMMIVWMPPRVQMRRGCRFVLGVRVYQRSMGRWLPFDVEEIKTPLLGGLEGRGLTEWMRGWSGSSWMRTLARSSLYCGGWRFRRRRGGADRLDKWVVSAPCVIGNVGGGPVVGSVIGRSPLTNLN